MNFVVAVGKNKKTGQLCYSPAQEFYKIQRGFICPVYIFKYDQAYLVPVHQLMKEPGKKSRPVGDIAAAHRKINSHLQKNIV